MICLDEVKELGSYIEVEKISEDDNANEVQNELFTFLESLGVNKENRETHGYDTLLYIKNNKIS
jgi:predicted adenylyl cyclase CyaB